ncbi:MAG: EAL domain-containing protein, partial [Acidimicrobiia bacterium]
LRSERLEDLVLETLRETQLDPSLLELEVTERVASADDARSVATLGRLRDRGVRIAVDDFGTGYSSLARLRDFPVDNVKIDRTFVSSIQSSTDDSPIVDGAISLAHAVGAIVTAEGIETPEQFRYLEAKGCEIGQGFLLGRPESPEHAERFLVRHTPVVVIA